MSVIASMVWSAWAVSSVWSIFAVALFVVWGYYRIKYRRFIELGNKLPGPFSLPVLGNAPEALFYASHSDVFQAFWEGSAPFRKYGLGRLWLGPRLVVGVWNPEDTESILSSSIHLKKTPEYDFFRPWLGNGLLISSGEKWKAHRKLIVPTFHLSVLKTFVSVFNENSRATVERMKKEIGKEFDAHDYMVETTVEILLETAMGVNKKTQENAYDYGTAVMKMCEIIHHRHLRLWLRSEFLFSFTKYAKLQEKLLNTIHSLTKTVIRKKNEERMLGNGSLDTHEETMFSNKTLNSRNLTESLSVGNTAMIRDDLDEDCGEKKRKPFLDQLIELREEGAVLSDTEIKEQVDTIMFEGHDTTAAAASFFLCIMGNHPEFQERCMEELREIFGETDRPATFQDTLEMKYLERCILETIRMYPPVPVIGRLLEEDMVTASKYVIPAGTTVGVLPYGLHHWEKNYAEPEVYNPDNFLPENIATRHPYAFVPFSSGPRSCVGRKYAMLKLKILLSTILRNYKIRSDIPEHKFRLQADIILKRADGFKITIEPRRNIASKT